MRSLKAFVLSLLVLSVSAFSSQAGQVQRLFYTPYTLPSGFAFTNDSTFPANFDPTEFNAGLDLIFLSKGLEENEVLFGPNGPNGIKIGDNFGTFTRGFFEAPQSGGYYFYLASDDDSELWLSTDTNPANKRKIGQNYGAVGFRNYTAKANQRSVKVILTKGQKYYFEHYFRQGGGAEYFSVAWSLPDGTFQSPVPPKSLNLFSQYYVLNLNGGKVFKDLSQSPPTIISEYQNGNLPATTTILEHTNTALVVNISGAQPISYQWHSIVGSTDTVLAGEILSSLTLTNVPTTLNGTKYYVVASNSAGTLNSAVTTMAVSAETIKPTLVSVDTFGRPDLITVKFSEPVDPTTALNIANYTVTNPNQNITLVSAAFFLDQTTVQLKATAIPSSPDLYTVAVANIKDLASNPNVIDPTNKTFSTVAADGTITKRQFNNIGGVSVGQVTGDSRYPNNADITSTVNSIDQPQTSPNLDNFATTYTGYFIPKVTGNYRFAVSSDDNSALFLSTNDTAAAKVQIAREPNWNNYKEFTGDNNGGGRNVNGALVNQSTNIPLVAGKAYYIEGIMHEGGGGDNFAVAVLIPGDSVTSFANNMATIPSVLLSSSAAASSTPISITTQPADKSVQENKALTFSVTAAGTGPLTYQWYGSNAFTQAFIPLGDGTTATYTPIPQALFSDSGSQFLVTIRNNFMIITSAVATATITADNTAPVISKVTAWYTQNRATVTFSELIDPTTALNIANYSFTPALTITNAVLSPNGTDVILGTSAMTPGTTYTLTVNNVKDIASVPNTIAANSTIQFGAWVLSRGFAMREWWYNNGGTSLAVLRNISTYPDYPDFFDYVNRGFSSPQTSPDVNNYSMKMSAILTVPVSGDYYFYISGDDSTEFYLSNNGTAAGLPYDPGRDPGNRLPFSQPIAGSTVANNNYDQVGAATGIPLPLQAGVPRYIEALLKEGGGGDYVRVAMNIYPDPLAIPVNVTPIIPAAYLAAYADPFGASVNIQVQPTTAVTVDEGSLTNLSLNAVGTIATSATNAAPLTYIWQEKFANTTVWVDLPAKVVNGTNVNSFAFGPVTANDNGAQVRVLVSTLGASVTSTPVNITVNSDTIKPKLVNAAANSSGNTITLSFDEKIALSGPSVTVTTLNAPATTLIVQQYIRQANGTNVTLVLSDSTPILPGTKYTVTVNGGITDLATTPNSVDPTANSKVFTGWSFVKGFIQRNYWANVGGGGLNDVINVTNRAPDTIAYETQVETPNQGTQDNFATVFKGWMIPPVTGTYIFAVSSDDNSGLYLAEDANPANLDTHTIAYEPQWNNNRDYATTDRRNATSRENVSTNNINGNPKWQQSDGSFAINLIQNQAYYFEYLQKEGGGGDNGSVTWYIPGSPVTMRTNVTGTAPNLVTNVTGPFYIVTGQPAIQGSNLGVYANPDLTTLTITVPPANVVTSENSTVTLSVTALGSSFFKASETVSYQWMSNGVDIVGARSRTYSFFATLPNGSASVVLPFSVKAFMTSPFATNLTANATVTVNANTTNPTLVSVSSLNPGIISATFSRTLLSASANSLANYSLPNGGSVTSAVLQADGRTVLLGVSGQTNVSFGLNVNGLQDNSATTRTVNTNIATIVVNPFFLTDIDIGNPSKPGSTLMLTNNVFIMTAGGGDIWNNQDQFHMAYMTRTNDFDLKVQTLGFQNIGNANMGNYAKAGLIVRENLTAGSRTFYNTTSPTTRNNGANTGANDYETNKRDVADQGYGGFGNGVFAPSFPNAWVRIQRVGNTFNTFASTDGKVWTSKGSLTPSPAYPAIVFVGLAGCNNDNNNANLFNFANLSDVTSTLSASLSSGNIIVTFPATGSATYKLQGTDSLDTIPATWVDVAATQSFTNDGNVTFSVASSGAKKFYRLISR